MIRQPTKESIQLIACAIVSSLLYSWLLFLGPRYALEVNVADRPLLLVIGIYLAASLVYLAALRIAIRTTSTRWFLGFLLVTSLWFRALLLPTPPFQEIDLYRYLWDGAMTANRLDPYAVAPQQIVDQLDGIDEASEGDTISQRLEVIDANPAMEPIIRTIHYAELPSPYPPISQVVFAASHATAGSQWSETARVRWLKGWLTAFDLATLLLVLRLLWRSGLPRGWGIAYGWCPLVLKEFAGSGHLDSIAIFFTLAALTVAVEAFALANRTKGKRTTLLSVGASCLLALGVGAKLYPIVLAPLLAITLLRRFGWRTASYATIGFLVVTTLTLLPMLLPSSAPKADVALEINQQANSSAVPLPLPPGASSEEEANFKTKGLSAFLKQWEMNDLLFMAIYENLLSQQEVPDEKQAWFDVTPESWSKGSWGSEEQAFLLTRLVTLSIFSLIALTLVIWASRSDTPSKEWLRAAFLTIAWFWLLAPTQNPWYWCWALPLLPFARSAAWRWFAVVLFAYYLRFWLETHAPDVGFLGTPYDGKYFFYYFIAWLEHGPLLVWLAIESFLARLRPNVASLTDAATRNV